jgi:putrescine aminotransferase
MSVGKHHMVMRAVRDTMLISPPLVISRDECDILVDRARKTLDDLADELTRDGTL